MQCDDVRDALSARLDGEPTGLDDPTLHAHLAGCPSCRSFDERLADVHRRIRVRPAEVVPDLSTAIMARVAPATPARTFARVSLLVVAIALGLVTLPTLLSAPGPHAHETRHFAIYDLALAAGFAYVVVRPWVARALLPMFAALGVLMLAGAVVDAALGGDSSLGDSHHVLQFVGIALVALLARPGGEGWVARRQVARRAPHDRPDRAGAASPTSRHADRLGAGTVS